MCVCDKKESWYGRKTLPNLSVDVSFAVFLHPHRLSVHFVGFVFGKKKKEKKKG